MRIRRVHLSEPRYTDAQGARDQFDQADFEFSVEGNYVICTSKVSGAVCAYPQIICTLTLEPRAKK